MSKFDPISWGTIEAVIGSPAAGVTEYVEQLSDDVSDEKPPVAVKAIYDAWKDELGDDRTIPDQGAAFVIAYLLEREGAITLEEPEQAIPSITDRRPSGERLCELF